MAIFSSKFKRGRTTPQIVGHPFTEGADPPTPITAANTGLPQNQSPRTVKIGSSSSPSTKGRKDVLASTPSSAGRSYSSPTKWGKCVASTPIAMLPPSLPPPAYALPPTPEASPDRRASAIFVGSLSAGHSRKPSLGLNSKTLPAPPTSFTSPNIHTRTGSAPLSASQRIDSRSRSASASVFNSHNPTMQGPYPLIGGTSITLDAEFEASPIFKTPASGTFGYGSHEPKHRPTALKLKTSNLSPQIECAPQTKIRKIPSPEAIKQFQGQSGRSGFDNDAVKSSGLFDFYSHLHHPRLSPNPNPGRTPAPTYSPRPRPSPTRHQFEETIRPSSERGERPRSFSTNDALNITELDKLRGINETPRKQRSQPTFNAPHPPLSPTPGRNPCNTSGPSSATSDMSTTPGSSYASLPTTTSLSGVKLFDYLPIPWCTRSASDLLAEIGEASYTSLIEGSLHEQASVPPQLLHPTILQNSKSEEDRLRSELSRLKEKHLLLVGQRESLAKKVEQGTFKVDQAKLHKMVQALGQASRRVDRVSRQIYICNDQIRQIEIEAKEHVVGVMKLVLERRDLHELGKKDGQYEVEIRAEDSSVVLTPRSHGSTTTTVRFLELPTPSPKSPAKLNEGMRINSNSTARPMSTATVIGINSLSFPVPPDRKRNDSLTLLDSTTSLPDLSDECTGQGVGGGLQVEICGTAESADGEFEIESTDFHTTAISITGPSNEILIYPPGHHRSLSAPLLGLEVPHSAYRSEDGHAPLDMGVIDNHHFKHNHERSISESDLLSPPVSSTLKITAPLRIRNQTKPTSQGRSQRQASSLTMRVNENREMKRVRMGRESVLETPESILLSLATVPIWTKQAEQE
ncbi:hypothetical protein I302_107622 [Kwoniella bestiolae CBS 10118]|uniref:Uncharacterized protein n=1 Tax=Kwoniella bestiolae CBS 10118 TaxID=1296100 RepID=A0A1B9FY08_9TREE|nr:hypothetical protein I302_06639 [Kwoniella bestiolae CBS 10118]OCF23656.1 hypothetical protein I302_06639 [Kwoniella bestiolae CBS 10118]